MEVPCCIKSVLELELVRCNRGVSQVELKLEHKRNKGDFTTTSISALLVPHADAGLTAWAAVGASSFTDAGKLEGQGDSRSTERIFSYRFWQ